MKTVKIDGVEMTLEQAHIKLWNWLADNPSMEKGNFYENHNCSFIPIFECFACECAGIIGSCRADCTRCPITWGTENDEGYEEDKVYCLSLYEDEDFMPIYDRYESSGDLGERSNLAHQIAKMEWKEK